MFDREADERRRAAVARLRRLEFEASPTATTLDLLRDLRSCIVLDVPVAIRWFVPDKLLGFRGRHGRGVRFAAPAGRDARRRPLLRAPREFSADRGAVCVGAREVESLEAEGERAA